MQKLKILLNPLNIPYQYQDDILGMIDNDNLSLLNEDDIIEALNEDGEVRVLNLTNQDLEDESHLNSDIKNELIKSKSIIIIFEVSTEMISDEHKKFIDYVYSFVEDDTTVKFDFVQVDNPRYEPIRILLTGYEDNDKFILEVGNDFTEYWANNSDYCFEEFKKMREVISEKISEPIDGIRLVGTSRSPNMVELSDAQTLQALRVFEFNEQTKEEFDKFTAKLEPILLKYLQNINPC